MTAIATIIRTIFVAIGLSATVILTLAILALYTGHGPAFAKVACAVQTDGVAQFSTCMYNAGQSID